MKPQLIFCSYLAYIPIYPGAEACHHHGGSYPQQLNQALPTGDSEADVHLSVSHVSSTLKRWVCLKIGKTPKPNGFADHYPY